MSLFFFYVFMNRIEQKGERTVIKVKSKDNHSFTYSIGIGISIALIISFLLMLGLTSLIINGYLKESGGTFGSFVIRTLSVFGGCLIAGYVYKEKILLLIGAISGIYLIVLMIISVAAFDHSFVNLVLAVISVLLGGVFAAVLRFLPKKRSTRNLHRIK